MEAVRDRRRKKCKMSRAVREETNVLFLLYIEIIIFRFSKCVQGKRRKMREERMIHPMYCSTKSHFQYVYHCARVSHFERDEPRNVY